MRFTELFSACENMKGLNEMMLHLLPHYRLWEALRRYNREG